MIYCNRCYEKYMKKVAPCYDIANGDLSVCPREQLENLRRVLHKGRFIILKEAKNQRTNYSTCPGKKPASLTRLQKRR